MRVRQLYDKLSAEDHMAYKAWLRWSLIIFGILILCGITAIAVHASLDQIGSERITAHDIYPLL